MKKLTLCFLLAVVGCASKPQGGDGATSLFKTVQKKNFSSLESHVAAASNEDQKKDAIAELTQAQDEEIQRLLMAAYKDCGTVMTGMSKKAEDGEQQAFWLQMSGLVLGAVVAPAASAANAMAHRALISAASGWAGATNLAGQSLRTSGMAGDADAQTRNQIAVAFKADIQEALDGSKAFESRRNAVLRARGECVWYAINVPGALPQIPANSSGGTGK